ncbi:phage baseplate protein [Pantoea sp. BAV 3049]|uniref:phage baseplate protein n=1 Tax=Pantoea sp. BAV 3049 TaxID=2654188 RepID=UPI00131EAFFF|nr:hypothetical protein [Pantoea sp. BAV 3049]
MAFTDLLGFLWNSNSTSTFSLSDESVGNLEFDSIDSETHDWQRDVTQNPVENGSPVADHIIERPRNLTVTGMISNTPVNGSNIFNSLVNGFNEEDAVAKAFSTLDALYKSKSLVTIYTRYAVYENMVITSINIPRTPDVGDAIVFTIQATQVRMVSTQTTSLPEGVGVKKQTDSSGKAGTSNSLDEATKHRAGGNQSLGKASSDVGTLEGLTKGIGNATDKLKNTLSEAIGRWSQ